MKIAHEKNNTFKLFQLLIHYNTAHNGGCLYPTMEYDSVHRRHSGVEPGDRELLFFARYSRRAACEVSLE